MFSSRLKSRFAGWLPLFGLLLAPVAACSGSDDEKVEPNDGASGAGGQDSSAAAAPSDGARQPVIPCSCVTPAESGSGISLCQDGMDALRTLCARVNAVNDYMLQTGGICEEGTRLYHNVVYGPGVEIPVTEAPLGTDQDEIESCVQYTLNGDTPMLSWEDGITDSLCFTEAIWDCNGAWYSDNCGDIVLEPDCSK